MRSAQFAQSWIDVPPLAAAPGPLPFLSIVVPARDEERSIERCLRSLLAQEWLDFELIAVDDRSSDATPSILARLASEHPRLRAISGDAMPEGWVGKPWALHQGARAARGAWLLFTDADTWHAPHASASTLAFALGERLDALSIVTWQELGGFWERATLPTILGTILFAGGPLGDINDPAKPKKALANGQYLLVSRAAYDALGGHAALRAEIVEDIEFARRIKADGRFRFALAGGGRLAHVRMYRSLGEIWRGFSKNVYAGAGGNAATLATGLLFMLALSVLPPALAVRAIVRGRGDLALEAAACPAASMATASWAVSRIGLPRSFGFFAPLGCALFAAITLNSTWRGVTGRGVEWRGRRYSSKAKPRKADEPSTVSPEADSQAESGRPAKQARS